MARVYLARSRTGPVRSLATPHPPVGGLILGAPSPSSRPDQESEEHEKGHIHGGILLSLGHGHGFQVAATSWGNFRGLGKLLDASSGYC